MYNFNRTVKQVEAICYLVHIWIYTIILVGALVRLWLIAPHWAHAIGGPSAIATYHLLTPLKRQQQL